MTKQLPHTTKLLGFDLTPASETPRVEMVAAADESPIEWGGLTLEAGTALVKVLAMGPYAYTFLPMLMEDHPYLIVNSDGEIIKLMARARDKKRWTFIADSSSKGWAELQANLGGKIRELRRRITNFGRAIGVVRGGYAVLCRPWVMIALLVILVLLVGWCLHRATLVHDSSVEELWSLNM